MYRQKMAPVRHSVKKKHSLTNKSKLLYAIGESYECNLILNIISVNS